MQKPRLIANKLHIPTISQNWIHRPQLSRRLNEGLEVGRHVTLISAPAGFGKTTCAVEWVAGLKDWPVSWLSLDPLDDDPVRFVEYFLAALQGIEKSLGKEIERVLLSGQLPPADVISTVLINDILQLSGKFVLVLDDFQVIQDQIILEVFKNLLRSLPAPFYLVLVTREDPPLPLAQLRASNQLTEVRIHHLRFTKKETAHLLNDMMDLSLTSNDLDILVKKTEGWIAGLQLASISLVDQANPADFIASLSGSHRFILSYLTEEVLDRQLEDIRNFMLYTSILGKFNNELCDEVTGRNDSRALLERLHKNNLFLVPLDEEHKWFRYSHLFNDLLLDLLKTLPKEQICMFHQRAASWYARMNMVDEAVQHALAAGDYALVVEMLEKHAMGMIMQGYAKTVHTWIEAIPEKWRLYNPKTNLAFAWMHLLRGAYLQIIPYVERLEAYFSEGQEMHDENKALKAEWLVLTALLLLKEDKLTESLAMIDQALQLAPESNSHVLCHIYYGMACVYWAMDDHDRVKDAYQKSITHGRAAGNVFIEMMGMTSLAAMAFEHGQLHLAYDIIYPLKKQLDQSASLPPISMVVFGIIGEIKYQWFKIKEARSSTARALRLSRLSGSISGMTNCHNMLSRLALLEGDMEKADEEMQKAMNLLQVDTPAYTVQEITAQQVRTHLAGHRVDAAEMALSAHGFSFNKEFIFPSLPDNQRLTYATGLMYNSSLRVVLYRIRQSKDIALIKTGKALADQLEVLANEGGHFPVMLETLLIRGQLYAEAEANGITLGDYRADILHALEIAESEGYISVFLEHGSMMTDILANLCKEKRIGLGNQDYIRQILDAFQRLNADVPLHDDKQYESQSVEKNPQEGLIEPLTERERDVLRLMSEGLKYKEIAEKLYISLNTVRYHVKAAYGKLNVNNRTQAIEKSYRLKLL